MSEERRDTNGKSQFFIYIFFKKDTGRYLVELEEFEDEGFRGDSEVGLENTKGKKVCI